MVENPRSYFLCHTKTVVRNGDLNMIAREGGLDFYAIGIGFKFCKTTALVGLIYSIYGIRQNVHKYLIELTWKTFHQRQGAIVHQNLDFWTMFVGFEAVAEDENSAVDAFVDIECLFPIGVGAGEGAETAADGDNPIASISHGFNQFGQIFPEVV